MDIDCSVDVPVWSHGPRDRAGRLLALLLKAETDGVSHVVPLDVESLASLILVNRPGAWRSVSTKVMDPWTFMLEVFRDEKGGRT